MKKNNYWVSLLALCCCFGLLKANHDCATAIPLTVPGVTLDNTVGGSITLLPTGFGAGNLCVQGLSSGNFNAPQRWFFLIGTGNVVTLTTCNVATTFDTQLRVLTAPSCAGPFTLVAGNDDMAPACAVGSFRSTLCFCALPGQLYYVVVDGFFVSGQVAIVASIGAACGPPPPPPLNDLCAGAFPINCNTASVTGNTVNAGADIAPFCGTSSGSGGGVWYQFNNPTPACVRLTTCNNVTNYDTKIRVYTGTCANLICVTGNDDDFTCTTGPGIAGFKSTVTFNAAANTNYWVLVHGFGSSVGDFRLDITCLTPPLNDNCAGALPIACGQLAIGSTALCFSPDPAHTSGTCGTSVSTTTSPGAWYTFTGTGSSVALSTCNSNTNFDTQLRVFTGPNCNTLTCLTGNDDQAPFGSCTTGPGVGAFKSRVQFCSQLGKQYWVLVYGFGSASGDFGLSLTCDPQLTVNAGQCQTRFIGYTGPGAPADTLFLCPTTTGGSGTGYAYSISPAALYRCANGCFAVRPDSNTTYTITVTDSKGCTASSTVSVQVINVVSPCSTPGNSNKVLVCHVPPGNPGNAHNICINHTAVPAHIVGGGLGHGTCYLGPCNNPCRATNPSCDPLICNNGQFTVTISGTGFLDETTWTFGGSSGGPYGFGTTNNALVTPNAVPATFCISTVGFFNDNVANYSISCGGVLIASGTIGGGQSTCVSGICCNGLFQKDTGPAVTETSFTSNVIAYPNPFSSVTTFRFRTAMDGNASLTLYNIAGSQVGVVFNGRVKEQGVYEIPFDAEGLSSGVYLFRFVGPDSKISFGKVNLVK